MSQSFTYPGTGDYIAAPELMQTVNVAVQLGRPLLIKGEPGTGKTMLAQSIARGLDMPLIAWNIKSTTKAQDGLYVYDTVQRLYDGQFGDGDVSDIARYIKLGKLGEAFASPERVVLLIDEIDKADLEFPNDLLWELDRWSSTSPRPHETVARRAPADRDHHLERREGAARRLPAPLRLPLHRVPRPGDDGAHRARARPATSTDALLELAIEAFYWLRDVPGPAEEALDQRADRLGAGAGARRRRPDRRSPRACPSSACCSRRTRTSDLDGAAAPGRASAARRTRASAALRAGEDAMFTDFFFLLRAYGVPVTVTEWLTLMRALAAGARRSHA